MRPLSMFFAIILIAPMVVKAESELSTEEARAFSHEVNKEMSEKIAFKLGTFEGAGVTIDSLAKNNDEVSLEYLATILLSGLISCSEKFVDSKTSHQISMAYKSIEEEECVSKNVQSVLTVARKDIPTVQKEKDFGITLLMGKSNQISQSFMKPILSELAPKLKASGTLSNLDKVAYSNALQKHVKKNWHWSSGAERLVAKIKVLILSNGEVKNVEINQSSGNSNFDDSIVRAVLKASPLPSAPPAIYPDFTVVIFTFDSTEQ